ncbi:LysR family transcriptional regulator [Pannonibacter phragmitetus]|uniref:LysR family transcriptional regulator n=1 Tax=Pannonibacter phragmitetus TaxID=121719 RepID=UPI003D2F0615
MRNLSYKFDLSRLSAFIAVCEEASITQAAVRLGVAQPALSATIRRLEADLGNTLFRRLPRGMDVTDAGKLLLERSYEIFSLVQDAERGLLTTAEEPQGEVAIGLPPQQQRF